MNTCTNTIGIEPISPVLESLKALEIKKFPLSAEVADIRTFIDDRAGS